MYACVALMLKVTSHNWRLAGKSRYIIGSVEAASGHTVASAYLPRFMGWVEVKERKVSQARPYEVMAANGRSIGTRLRQQSDGQTFLHIQIWTSSQCTGIWGRGMMAFAGMPSGSRKEAATRHRFGVCEPAFYLLQHSASNKEHFPHERRSSSLARSLVHYSTQPQKTPSPSLSKKQKAKLK